MDAALVAGARFEAKAMETEPPWPPKLPAPTWPPATGPALEPGISYVARGFPGG